MVALRLWVVGELLLTRLVQLLNANSGSTADHGEVVDTVTANVDVSCEDSGGSRPNAPVVINAIH